MLTEQLITPGQLKRVHMLLNELDLLDKETKSDIVSEFSNHRTTSSRQLTEEEAKALIRHLEDHTDSRQRMRRALLSEGYKLGWHRDAQRNGDLAGKHPSVINHYNVNEWCKSKRCAVGKPMEEMNEKELNTALTQLKQVRKKELNG